MKKYLFFPLTLILATNLFAQQVILPEVTKKVEFAGITIKLDTDAQKLVQKEVASLLTPENRYLMDKLERIQLYFPIIENILEEEEIPEDFKYLAVAESSLLADAVSSSNAVGFWQIKAETATEFGLRVDSEVDERKNIYSSTKAAAAYLKRNNNIYKNWLSTLYSYLLGAAGISKIVPNEWINNKEVSFDKQTDRYLIKTIAHRIAFEYRINRLSDNQYEIVEYRNSKGKKLSEIASSINVDLATLKKYNTWLQSNTIPTDKSYSVAILTSEDNVEDITNKASYSNQDEESEKTNVAYPSIKRITPLSASEEEPIFYEINGKKGILAKAGDDVASLARASKISIKKFLAYNDLLNDATIVEDAIYYLAKKSNKAATDKHILSNNESLWDISQKYGVSLKRLLKYNRLTSLADIPKNRSEIYLQKKRPKNDELALNTPPTTPNPAPNKIEENAPIETPRNTNVPNTSVPPAPKKPENPVVIQQETAPKPVYSQRDESDIIVISDDDDLAKPIEKVSKSTQKPDVITHSKPANNTESSYESTSSSSTSTESIKVIDAKPTTTYTEESSTTYTETNTSTNNPSYTESSRKHIVESGQTLYSIARQYNVSVRELASWNNFGIDEKVKIGQRIVVTKNASTSKPTKSTSSTNVSTSTHEVQGGQTLYSISKRYGVSVKQIKDWNRMTDDNVKIGQKLIIRK